jgi:hypothetical protein
MIAARSKVADSFFPIAFALDTENKTPLREARRVGFSRQPPAPRRFCRHSAGSRFFHRNRVFHASENANLWKKREKSPQASPP